MVNSMMGYVPLHVTGFLVICRNLAGVALANEVCHENFVIIVQVLVT